MEQFAVNERLEADSKFVCDLHLCRLLLMDDKRWPWLILVPRIPGAVEIHELEEKDQSMLQVETNGISAMMAEICQCGKINTGALGNIVRQLHVHVVVRNMGDENWPGPVWGYGTREPYALDERKRFIRKIRDWIVKHG